MFACASSECSRAAAAAARASAAASWFVCFIIVVCTANIIVHVAAIPVLLPITVIALSVCTAPLLPTAVAFAGGLPLLLRMFSHLAYVAIAGCQPSTSPLYAFIVLLASSALIAFGHKTGIGSDRVGTSVRGLPRKKLVLRAAARRRQQRGYDRLLKALAQKRRTRRHQLGRSLVRSLSTLAAYVAFTELLMCTAQMAYRKHRISCMQRCMSSFRPAWESKCGGLCAPQGSRTHSGAGTNGASDFAEASVATRAIPEPLWHVRKHEGSLGELRTTLDGAPQGAPPVCRSTRPRCGRRNVRKRVYRGGGKGA
jgi:hypothetical protein